MRWRNWNWLDLILLPLLMAVMRACWLTPWADAILRVLALDIDFATTDFNLRPALGAAVIVVVPLLSFWLARILTANLPIDEDMFGGIKLGIPIVNRLLLGTGGILTILLVLWWHFASAVYPLWDLRWIVALGQLLIHIEEMQSLPVCFALMMLIFLWMRGLLDAGRSLGHDDVWSAMSTGVGAIILYLIATYAFSASVSTDFSNWIVLFFTVGMAALAFSGLKITVGLNWALSGNRRNAKAPPLTRYWLISVGVVVGGLIGIGTGIGLLVAPEQVARLLSLLNGLARALWTVVSTIILTIAYVVFVIVYYILEFFRPAIERLLGGLADLAQLMPPAAEEMPPLEEPAALTVASMPDSYRWVGLVIFLVLVAIVFALIVRRLRQSQEVESDEVRESILSSDLLQDQLARLWNRLWGLGRRGAELDPFLSLEGESDTRRMIRQRYQQLLAASGQRGLARQKAETPREYRTNLVTSVDALGTPLATITERYNHARYAPEPPEMESAQEVEKSWGEVEARFATMNSPTENKPTEKRA